MSKIYVYSTLANDNCYTGYTEGGADIPAKTYEILIAGGAGVAERGQRLLTPRGVVTEITKEQAEQLATNTVFQRHVTNGFITVSDKKEDPENVAADMASRDPGGPLVDADYENANQKAPTTSKKK